MDVKLRIVQIGPSSSVQDAGRMGQLRYGVTESGVMDRAAHRLVNSALGNDAGASVLEISLAGVQILCEEGALGCAVGGGAFKVTLDGIDLPCWSLFNLTAGSTLQIRPGPWGSWCYLGFAAKLQAQSWLGSASVTMNSSLCGKPLSKGDLLTLSNARRVGDTTVAFFDGAVFKPGADYRVVMGPQDRFFTRAAIDALVQKEFEVSAEYNRMGMRLKGASLAINQALDMPSEPIARGSLQVPGHGDPICLMADHQTAGGYPKIATLISSDQDALAQCRTGDRVRFIAIDVVESIKLARAFEQTMQQCETKIAQNRQGLTERLWGTNLISGSVDAEQF